MFLSDLISFWDGPHLTYGTFNSDAGIFFAVHFPSLLPVIYFVQIKRCYEVKSEIGNFNITQSIFFHVMTN